MRQQLEGKVRTVSNKFSFSFHTISWICFVYFPQATSSLTLKYAKNFWPPFVLCSVAAPAKHYGHIACCCCCHSLQHGQSAVQQKVLNWINPEDLRCGWYQHANMANQQLHQIQQQQEELPRGKLNAAATCCCCCCCGRTRAASEILLKPDA